MIRKLHLFLLVGITWCLHSFRSLDYVLFRKYILWIIIVIIIIWKSWFCVFKILLEIARTKNNSPLPVVKSHCGIRLPPDRYCLSSCNYRLKSTNANKKVICCFWLNVILSKILLYYDFCFCYVYILCVYAVLNICLE